MRYVAFSTVPKALCPMRPCTFLLNKRLNSLIFRCIKASLVQGYVLKGRALGHNGRREEEKEEQIKHPSG